jgi:hypothetical protein
MSGTLERGQLLSLHPGRGWEPLHEVPSVSEGCFALLLAAIHPEEDIKAQLVILPDKPVQGIDRAKVSDVQKISPDRQKDINAIPIRTTAICQEWLSW